MTRATLPRGPIRGVNALAAHLARQFPEFRRGQMLAVLNAACVAIEQSLQMQAASGYARPSVRIGRLGAFELKWFQGLRCPALGGGYQDVPARWKPRFVISRAWRDRLKQTSAATRLLRSPAELKLPIGDEARVSTGSSAGPEAPSDLGSPESIPLGPGA
jgi:hypothetical protein